MRAPRVWDDRDILEDEPFLTRFAVRQLASQERRTRSDRDIPWNHDIGQEVLKTPGGVSHIAQYTQLFLRC